MKKITLIFGLLLVFNSTIKAQNIGIGIKAGTMVAKPYIIGTEAGSFLFTPNQKLKPGLYGGLYFTFPTFSDRLKIQTELLLTKSGSSLDSTAYSKKGSLSISQFQVPLMVQYAVLPRLKLNLGVYAGGILGVNEKVEGVRNDFAIFDYVDLDYGLLAGVEYQLSDKWSFDARGQLGLKNLILTHPSFTGPNVNYQTQTLSLGVKYKLNNNRRNY